MRSRMNRRDFLRWGVLATATVLAGCAQKTQPTAAPEATAAPTEVPVQATAVPPVAEPTRQPLKLVVWEWFDARKAYYEAMTKQWSEKHPEVSFDLQFLSWDDYWTKLRASVPAGTGPDIFRVNNGYASELVHNKFVEPLPEDLFPPEVLKAEMVGIKDNQLRLPDGKFYYLSDGACGFAMVANTTMWEEAGLTEKDYPLTWADFYALAQKLTKTDSSGEITTCGYSSFGLYSEVFRNMLYQQGWFNFTPDGKKVRFDSEPARLALQQLDAEITKYKVNTRKALSQMEGFGTGTIAITCTGSYWTGWIASVYPDAKWFPFDVPRWYPDKEPARDQMYHEFSLVANAQAPIERRRPAWEFIAWYFLGDDHTYLVDAAILAGGIPQRIKLQSDPRITSDPMMAVVARTLDRCVFGGDNIQALSDMLTRQVDQAFLQGGESLEATIQAIQSEGDAILGEGERWLAERSYPHADEFQP